MQKLGNVNLARMQHENDSPVRPDAKDRANRVWSSLTDIFSVSWLDRNGDEPPRTWIWKIDSLTDEQLKRGLEACTERVTAEGRAFMPNMPEFVELCKTVHPYDALALPPPEIDLIEERRIALSYGISFDETEGKTAAEVRSMVLAKRTGQRVA